MKQIKILNLSLRNFKGIKEFNIAPEGSDVNIYGDNATGKTSLMDAFMWLLFDKDSNNSSNFNIKTLDSLGKPIHMLEHEVIAKLDINNEIIELQKIYKEKWTKKKGQADSELTSHTTDHFINGVSKKLNEYKAYLSQIIDENTFKILTNPLHFNTNLTWKDRRNIALSITDEVADENIFKQDEKLLELKVLLINKSIDDVKAEMTSRRRKLNEELKSIPYRIDELSREIGEIDVAALTKEKKGLEGKLSDIKNSKGVDYDFRLRGIRGTINMLELKLEELKQDSVKGLRKELNILAEEMSKISKSYYEAKGKQDKFKNDEKLYKSDAEKISKDIERLRNRFREDSSKEFDINSTICPTCKQDLPVDDIEKQIENFNNNKQNTLNNINREGKDLKGALSRTNEELEGIKEDLVNITDEVMTLDEIIKGKKKESEDIEKQIKSINITESQEYKDIQEQISEVTKEKEEIEKLSKDQDNSNVVLELENQLSEINKELAKVDIAKDNEKRVDDLKKRERELANMVAETEKNEFLCDQYIILKANLLEDELNSMFKLVKFKLFDVQVNGGINETFVTTVDGVPFEDLNNAMKINAGLDIITTLSKYYELIAPIFLDNRESVNEIPDMEAQVINLIVSKHKNLRVEVQ